MSPAPGQPDRQQERTLMVREQLVQRGIAAPAVLAALERIPRELFVPSQVADRAYVDSALPIDCEQTISQPYMVAHMTERLGLQPSHRVLEIGTGSGYQTAILATLAAHVYTIEWHLKLLNQAATRLAHLHLHNVSFRCGDGSLGWPAYAPFDAILVTAGAPDVPEPLPEQLAVGGRLIVPVGPLEDQVLACVERTATGYTRHEALRCRFVKLWGQAGWRA
jgi:protein-L-isoaspartate(D-aspartate) O-methyltransferase